ncbi:uncharacterized protein LOC128628571 [Artibeus jamaicensis]|uniref:uncharacterized protein LOC128628571 n=1 Tax=Artibeus jamaicensis TaxID=9417 RepID=UPI00235B0DBE|nr:uncharacterized protein LOC128628571 [Artibeus jamaicensis]
MIAAATVEPLGNSKLHCGSEDIGVTGAGIFSVSERKAEAIFLARNTKSPSTHILNSPSATRSNSSWGRAFSSIPRGDSPRCTAARRVPRCAAGPSNLTVDLPALGAHPRELRLPLTFSQIWRGQTALRPPSAPNFCSVLPVAAAATAAAAGAQPCRLQRRGAGMRRLEPQSGASLPAAGWRPGAPLASLALAFLPYGAAASSSPVLRHLRLQGWGMPLSPGSGRRGPRPFCSSASPSPPRRSQAVPTEGGRAWKAMGSGPSAGAPRRRRTPRELWITGVYRLHVFERLNCIKTTWKNARFASQAQATYGSTQTHARDASWHKCTQDPGADSD